MWEFRLWSPVLRQGMWVRTFRIDLLISPSVYTTLPWQKWTTLETSITTYLTHPEERDSKVPQSAVTHIRNSSCLTIEAAGSTETLLITTETLLPWGFRQNFTPMKYFCPEGGGSDLLRNVGNHLRCTSNLRMEKGNFCITFFLLQTERFYVEYGSCILLPLTKQFYTEDGTVDSSETFPSTYRNITKSPDNGQITSSGDIRNRQRFIFFRIVIIFIQIFWWFNIPHFNFCVGADPLFIRQWRRLLVRSTSVWMSRHLSW
jgi:hypothetical protein